MTDGLRDEWRHVIGTSRRESRRNTTANTRVKRGVREQHPLAKEPTQRLKLFDNVGRKPACERLAADGGESDVLQSRGDVIVPGEHPCAEYITPMHRIRRPQMMIERVRIGEERPRPEQETVVGCRRWRHAAHGSGTSPAA